MLLRSVTMFSFHCHTRPLQKSKQINNEQNEIIPAADSKSKNFKRKNKIFKYILLGGLFFASIIIDLYLLILKKIRGSIIFPGN